MDMKFCPFCGASLVDGAFFCGECGETMPRHVELDKPADDEPEDDAPMIPDEDETGRKPNLFTRIVLLRGILKRSKRPLPSSKNTLAAKKQRPRKRRRPEFASAPAFELLENGYDGYYNDIKPADDNRVHERVDRGLIKQIAYFAAGAVVIIILSIVAMYLL